MSSPLPSQTLKIPIPRGLPGPGVTEVRNWPCDPAKLQVFWGPSNDPRKYTAIITLPFAATESLATLQDVQFAIDPADPSGQTYLITDGDVLTYDATAGIWNNQRLDVANISTPATYTDPTSGATHSTNGMILTSDGAGGSTWEVPPGGFTFGSGVFGTYSYAAGSVPPGTIQQFAMPIVPQGWLLCDGAAVSRTTYNRLYSAIGTNWGIGNGTTSFNVPNIPAISTGGSHLYYGVHI